MFKKSLRPWLLCCLVGFLVLAPVVVWAKPVMLRFAWNANTETDLAGYTLYIAQAAGGPYTAVTTFGLVTQGDVVLDLVPKTTVYFVLDAFDDSGNHSGFSNEVSYFFVDTEPPGNPAGLRLLF